MSGDIPRIAPFNTKGFMTKKELEEIKNEFKSIVAEKIKREGISDLMAYLDRSDFYEAPASKFGHSDYEGGLVTHSLNVYNRLRKYIEVEYGNFDKYSEESIALVSLFHDLCKVDYYKIEMRNVKENGEWVQKPFYKIEDRLPYGHGEKSVYIINGFLRLTREEALAINWHMGGFDARVTGGSSLSLGETYKHNSLAFWLHLADMTATYIDENSLNSDKEN